MAKMRIILRLTALTLLGIFFACNGREEPPIKLFVKELEVKDVTIEWYFHSLIGSTSPDYVVALRGKEADTICVADNIANVAVQEVGIKLEFFGNPQRNMQNTKVKRSVFGHRIIIDTSVVNPGPTGRSYYIKE